MNDEGVKYFTVEEANALLPTISPLVQSLKDAQSAMEERQDRVMESIPTNGGGPVYRAFIQASTDAANAALAIDAMGIIMRDPESGLLDFPAMRDGHEVYLCWRLGESTVAFWHPTDTGVAGRRPL